jgi:hypothetical protein
VRRPLVILIASLLALAGCGGGEDGGEPTPREKLESAVTEFERAVGDQDCAGFARFAHSVVRPAGKGRDDPPDAAECRNLGRSYTALFGFDSEKIDVFGSAAIVQGRVEGRLLVLVWTLDVDGRWAQVQAIPAIDPQVRGRERPMNRFAPNAAAFVKAQRAGDCREVFRLLNPASPFVAQAGDPEAFCKRFRESRDAPERLSAQLRQAPDAEPVDLGGTSDLHFYRVDTGRGRRWTLILSTLPRELPAAGHAQDSVLDYFPNSR